MAKQVPVDRLASAIDKILSEYGEDTKSNLDSIVRDVTKKGATTLRAQSKSAVNGSGRYAKGWKAKVELTRFGAEGTIYNASLPGLPHLLEYGHALRGGGRTRAITHIKPVEDALVREFESKVKSKL